MGMEVGCVATSVYQFERHIIVRSKPASILEEKEVYEQIGRTPRPKDLEGKKALRSIIEEYRYRAVQRC